MAQWIGIRYTENGVRILGLVQADDGFEITGIAAGSPGNNLKGFLEERGFSLEDSAIVCGLCPGDFISATIQREDSMDEDDVKSQLRWEIERKMISDPNDYTLDFALSKIAGFVFAAKKSLIQQMTDTLENVVIDVEPISLYNGCEISGAIGDGSIMLVSAEAEGISSVIIDNGSLRALESIPIRDESLNFVLADKDQEIPENEDTDTSDKLSGYIVESVKRLTSLGDDKSKATPESIALVGGGVYTGKLANKITEKTGISTAIFNPFTDMIKDVESNQPELADMSAAFATCFGLAVRAID
ncbi:hypothetical protein ES708_20611 [subsurface metagenome]